MTSNYHDPLSYAFPLNSAAFNVALGQLDNAITGLDTRVDTLEGIQTGASQVTQLSFTAATQLTISGGVITVSQSVHTIEGESAAADDLDTISGYADSDFLMISAANASHAITVKHNTGNIFLSDAMDRVLDTTTSMLILRWNGSKWIEHKFVPYISARTRLDSTLYRAEQIQFPDRTVYQVDSRNARVGLRPNGGSSKIIQVDAVGASPFVAAGTMVAPTVNGTASASNDTDSAYTNFLTVATTASTGGIVSTSFNYVRRQHNPVGHCIIRTGAAADIANIRFFIGLFSAAPANADDPSASCIGFRYSTATDGGWVGIVSSGAGNVSVTSSLGSVAASTRYKLSWRIDDTNAIAYFSLNDGTESTLSTNLPAAATELGLLVRIITTANVAKNFKMSRVYVEFS